MAKCKALTGWAVKGLMQTLLARDAFVRTNRCTIAMMLVCLSVCLGPACIVIIQCTLPQLLLSV